MNLTDAMALLEWAHEKNPGPWREHSKGVARAAQKIAEAVGLDGEKAYLLGLMHDIGRYEGPRGLHHAIAGYALLMKKGWADAARIAVTHSFPTQSLDHFGGGALDVNDDEMAVIQRILAQPFDDYDRLIQLCDAISWGEGVCLMEKRLVDVVIRHGIFEGMDVKWKKWFEIKSDFERRMGRSIYSLFPEAAENTFGL